jgi:hypothetical protein
MLYIYQKYYGGSVGVWELEKHRPICMTELGLLSEDQQGENQYLPRLLLLAHVWAPAQKDSQ